MKKFEFSLQKLLNLREFEEHEAEVELGKAISESDKIRNQLEDVAQKTIFNSKQTVGVGNYQDLVVLEQYRNRLKLLKEELLEELAKAEIVVEQKRAIFAEAMKNRKVLTNLKEKKFTSWKKEAQKAEENAIDDIVTSQWH